MAEWLNLSYQQKLDPEARGSNPAGGDVFGSDGCPYLQALRSENRGGPSEKGPLDQAFVDKRGFTTRP